MVQEAKSFLKKQGFSLKNQEYIAIKNKMDPHFNWLGPVVKYHFTAGKRDLEKTLDLYDDLKFLNIKVKEFKKVFHDEGQLYNLLVNADLDKRGYHIMDETDGLQFVMLSNVKGASKFVSPNWCIKDPKYFYGYYKHGIKTQYVLNLSPYRELPTPKSHGHDFTYDPLDDMCRLGLTFSYDQIHCFNEANFNLKNIRRIFEAFPKIFEIDLGYRIMNKWLIPSYYIEFEDIFPNIRELITSQKWVLHVSNSYSIWRLNYGSDIHEINYIKVPNYIPERDSLTKFSYNLLYNQWELPSVLNINSKVKEQINIDSIEQRKLFIESLKFPFKIIHKTLKFQKLKSS